MSWLKSRFGYFGLCSLRLAAVLRDLGGSKRSMLPLSSRISGGLSNPDFNLKELEMKKTLIRILLTTLFLVACGSTPVLAGSDGWPVPICYPNPCIQ